MVNREPDDLHPDDLIPTPDPIADKSLSGIMLVSSALLIFSLLWALYDEIYGQRPWKGYQQQFVKLYTSYLKKLGPAQAAAEKAVRSSPEFLQMERELEAAEREAKPRTSEIDRELGRIRRQLKPISEPFQNARAKIAALVYELEHEVSADRKRNIREEIEEVKKGPFPVALPPDDGTTQVKVENLTFDELEQRWSALKAREAQLNAERALVTAKASELRRKRDEYLKDRLPGLSEQQIAGLLNKMENFTIEIKQINVETAEIVDRCESCHVGIREPVTLTPAHMGGQRVFVSHPNKRLLEIHNPDRFGCTACHNGNGRATNSVQKAHGQYKHWLWPLFARENSEAGCMQCHFGDRVLEEAPTLTRGRDLYELKGCVGCHRFEGYDRETDALAAVRKQMQRLEMEQKAAHLEIARNIKAGDEAATNEEAQAFYAQAEKLRVNISNMDAKLEVLQQQAKYLMLDRKMVGPNLKEVRLKLRPEWIPVWLKDPQAFRPGTKMPRFRLSDGEIKAISAFIWQSGLKGRLAAQPAGDPVKGKEALETRGCLACHSIGEGNNRIGGEFAANLSRLGEKANYHYIVRWIHNPRERTRPYCPKEKRDLGPEDYAKNGLPFVFDFDHSTCPNDGAQLQIQQMTVMPSLRLSWQEARDIASYLLSLKRPDASYPPAPFMDDKKLVDQGRRLVRHYGCANCHEMSGLEDEQRIGTELTKEASKPIEQLDFGLLEPRAKKEGWYNHKGFFERKLENPAIYDQGRERPPQERLRMPNIQLTAEDRRALTTFLLGSLESPFFKEFRHIPAHLRYIPTDQQKDIQEGWWLITKYNCMGCHTIQAGQKSVLSTSVPRYQDPAWKEQLPPSLVQEGARVNPDWLTRFLMNPALSETDTDRNGVRTYLKARMPTFNFSPNEVRILVRFFEALSAQPQPYIAPKLEPLTSQERTLARALFSSRAAPCLKCHLVGSPSHDRFATAPNFLIAGERLKPDWTARWMIDPQAISPGTAMPSGLFKREGDRWVFAGPTPDMFKGYTKDHVQLLVRYMFQLTPEEQRRLLGSLPATPTARVNRIRTTVRAALSH